MASVAPELPALARDEAFEGLYRRYVADVYHYALALLRNPADAEDVTQTTFLNAYRAWRRGDEIRKPQNWLIKIAHNVARSRYARASRRVKEVPLEDHVEQLAVPEAERPDVEAVLQALGRLPFNQRAALVMRELEGRSYAEIADTIGVSVPAVETLIFRARRSLRLRASSLRSLAAVPVPSSLTQLFGGGGVVAGGGAVVGGGVAVKAAIALIAGAVATGVGVRDSGPANAASDPPTAVAFSASSPAAAFSPWQSVRATARGRLGRTVVFSHGAWPITNGALGFPAAAIVAVGAAVTNGAAASSGRPGSIGPISAPTLPNKATSVVETVEQAASNAVSAVPANPVATLPVTPPPVPTLPVSPPSVPPLPVSPPPVPPLPVSPPPVPTVPQVPQPPVSAPELPPLPPLPSLP